MDIEYQKKEVTWCLDRVGPRICLKATAINSKLQQLEITSDEFKLELENDEAVEFLTILRKITTLKPEATRETEPQSTLTKPIEIIKTTAPHLEKPKIERKVTFPIREPIEKPVPKLDTSEILEVLKQSENSINEERISFRKKFAENKALEEKTVIESEESEIKEETISSISNEESVNPLEVFREKLDTASFFGTVEEKSPLEQLLEETDGKDQDFVSEDSSLDTLSKSDQITERIQEQEEPVHFSPEDMNSSSFISKFSSKTFEQELEEQRSQTSETPQREESEQPKEEVIQSRPFLNEEERKKAIERARAERKKRLWELTRGF